jgi:hypothetical protein
MVVAITRRCRFPIGSSEGSMADSVTIQTNAKQ